MFELFHIPAFRTLFTAQIIALIGTGLTTIALALLAFELAGNGASIVLGTALAIKMTAYVFISPVITGLISHKNQKQYLILFDLLRAIIVMMLFFVTSIWQIYVLIFFLQAFSAGFTPIHQSVISDILKNDSLFIKGASLSRIAYNLENILSPTFAILILTFINYSSFFIFNTICFLLSSLLIFITNFPQEKIKKNEKGPLWQRAISGITLFLKNRNLLAILSLNMAIAASGAMILVNSVTIIQGFFGLSESKLAIAMLSYGTGAMLSAFVVFVKSGNSNYKRIMLIGAFLTSLISLCSIFIQSFETLLLSWLCFGFLSSFMLVPIGQILREETDENDRTAIFGAQFSLSHACWLISYPLIGYLLVLGGLEISFFIIGVLVLITTFLAWYLWYSSSANLSS